MEAERLIDRIRIMQTREESAAVAQAMRDYKERASPVEYLTVRQALGQRLTQLADQFEAEIAQTDVFIRSLRQT